MSREQVRDWLYLVGTLVCQAGGIAQIVKIHQTQSVSDFSFWWLLALLVTALMTLPRAVGSNYWVWKVSRGTHLVVTTILFISYILCLS